MEPRHWGSIIKEGIVVCVRVGRCGSQHNESMITRRLDLVTTATMHEKAEGSGFGAGAHFFPLQCVGPCILPCNTHQGVSHAYELMGGNHLCLRNENFGGDICRGNGLFR